VGGEGMGCGGCDVSRRAGVVRARTCTCVSWVACLHVRCCHKHGERRDPSSPCEGCCVVRTFCTSALSSFLSFLYGRYSVLHSGTWFSAMRLPNPTIAAAGS
jgi:hypothetical protein